MILGRRIKHKKAYFFLQSKMIGMNQRSSSEWEAIQLMTAAEVPPPDVSPDSQEYRAFLKSRLDLECAAVASIQKGQASAAPDNGSRPSNSLQLVAHKESTKLQDKDGVGPVGLPPLAAISKKYEVQGKLTTSGSSGEQSDDDEAKRMRRLLSNRESARRSRIRKQAHLTAIETRDSQLRVENSSLLKSFNDLNHKYNEAVVDIRVLKADGETLRAKVSQLRVENSSSLERFNDISHKYNEAAAENRVLKADGETLRAKVSQLGVENSSLLERFNDISHKYNEVAAANKVLKADGETLRAKVKMAEELVKRVIGFNPLFQAMSVGMPSFSGSPETSAYAAVPVQDDPEQPYYYYHAPPSSQASVQHHRLENGVLGIPLADNVQADAAVMGMTVSMPRVASLEHLQECIRGASDTYYQY